MKRRLFVASSLSSLGLAGCGSVGDALNNNGAIHSLIGGVQPLDLALIGSRGLAKTYRESEISSTFPIDSLPTPHDAHYTSLQSDEWRAYRLVVNGLVDRPQALDLAALRAMKPLEQIVRHDCVEGWSVISKWRGVRLADVLALAAPKQTARFVVFHCFDQDETANVYYESLNLTQAAHPQTMLALDYNGRPIEADHGAPVRLKIPTQLGYKSAKWVNRIELVDSFARVHGGGGGYWEDQGYEWYAGI